MARKNMAYHNNSNGIWHNLMAYLNAENKISMRKQHRKSGIVWRKNNNNVNEEEEEKRKISEAK